MPSKNNLSDKNLSILYAPAALVERLSATWKKKAYLRKKHKAT